MDINPKIVELTDENVCKICNNRHGKYTCPRCNIYYCSLNCYKAETHSECSENFYRDFVMGEMQGPSSADQNKMYEILSRLNQPDGTSSDGYDDDSSAANDTNTDDMDSDDEQIQDLKTRMTNVDLNNADLVWDKLTHDEKQEFEALVHNGDFSKLLPEWQPWWGYRKQSPLVQYMETRDFDYKKSCPKLKDVKEFSQISSVMPSECVKFNIINLLAAYSFTARYFNGDFSQFPKEAANLIIQLSSCLRTNSNFFDISTALAAVEIDAGNCSSISYSADSIKLLSDDSRCFLLGPETDEPFYYIKVALSDVFDIFETQKLVCVKTEKSTSTEFSNKFMDMQLGPDIAKKDLQRYIKKVEYYLSYIKTYGLVF